MSPKQNFLIQLHRYHYYHYYEPETITLYPAYGTLQYKQMKLNKNNSFSRVGIKPATVTLAIRHYDVAPRCPQWPQTFCISNIAKLHLNLWEFTIKSPQASFHFYAYDFLKILQRTFQLKDLTTVIIHSQNIFHTIIFYNICCYQYYQAMIKFYVI